MINLANRTEYSFRIAYGHLEKVIEANGDVEAIGICDRHSTWGHVAFQKECKDRKIKPIFGVELAVVDDPTKEEKQGARFIRFIALNNEALADMYRLVTKATEQFYYFPRIGLQDINQYGSKLTILTSRPLDLSELPAINKANIFLDLHPGTQLRSIEWAKENNIEPVATSDNFYPYVEDEEAYQVCIGRNADSKTTPMHILSDDWEWKSAINGDEEFKDRALRNAITISRQSTTEMPKAKLVHPSVDKTLRQMCEEAAVSRGIDLGDEIYRNRLDRELELIHDKEFEDYFFLISDMVAYAKQHMLVGPARGSSCGSLVCYLLSITDIDPIPYDLLFERFIDVNRKDLPDIDIDFPEDKREMVFDYLRKTYGTECVAQLGTVSRYKAKNTIGDVAKELGIPQWEVKDLKDAIIERSGGDARAAFCIMDTFNELEIGKRMLEKYPELKVAEKIEAHARHSGRHAAGIVVTADPVYNYCSIDVNTGSTQVDKYDAEALNLLKIDALGLRTLTLIQDCLDQVGWSRGKLHSWRHDDEMAFAVLNDKKFTGIFQFEGYALQSLCQQMKVETFEDIVSLTALARPGPLISGMANEWLQRRTGKKQTSYENPLMKDILKTSLGVCVYQEQIMRIAREVGQMSWEDVSSLRKAMSKSLGKEFFDKYRAQFLDGAVKNNFPEQEAAEYWDKMCSFGSWSFNRSHAVAYGTVSYWCLILKAYFPLEYAAASLRHSKDEAQQIRLLRELKAEGYDYKAFDKDKSQENWSVQDGILIGGLTGVKGIGKKTAQAIIDKRAKGIALSPKQSASLDNAQTPYDMIYECRERFGHILDDPAAHGFATKITSIKDITDQSEGVFLIFGKLKEKNLRDHNELIEIKKRNGKVMEGQTLFLNLTIEDDTDTMRVGVGRFEYIKYGKPIVEGAKIGDWFAFKGMVKKGFRKMYIQRVKKLS